MNIETGPREQICANDEYELNGLKQKKKQTHLQSKPNKSVRIDSEYRKPTFNTQINNFV